MTIEPRDRLIVALDLPSVADAERLTWQLGDAVSFYKIGYQLGYAGGLDFARDLIASGKKVFLDLKLHDIGNTVGKGVESIVKIGATFLTVHAYPQTMKAALDARRGSPLKVLAVTILTSYNDADVTDAGYHGTAPDQVKRKSLQAKALGIDGIVCSAEESAMLRPLIGAGHAAGDAGHPPGGRRERRPETHHDAGGGDRGGLGLSRGRPADYGKRRSESGRGGDRRGDRGGRAARTNLEEERMAKGYWIGRVDVNERRRLQALCGGQSGDLQEIRRPLRGARRQVRDAWKAPAARAMW